MLMKLIVFGDIHDNLARLDHVRDEITSSGAVVITGDLTQFGGIEDACKVIDAIKPLNPNIYAQAGNLDDPAIEEWLAGKGISLHGRGHVIGDIGLFGAGGSNPSPFGTPNEFSEEEIAEILARGYDAVRSCPFKIMVPHMPPYNTKTDILHSGLHAGSRSVRAFIEKEQPHLCITGHIHEAVGEDHIGATRIINPGPFFKGGFVIIEREGERLDAELRSLV